MRIRFDLKKKKMYKFLRLMKEDVQKSMNQALEYLEKKDLGLAHNILEHDVDLDRYRYQLEEYCGTIIATQQPVASELRELLMGIKLSGIFERMGDHACQLVKSLQGEENYNALTDFLPSFQTMLSQADKILDGVMEAYFSSDLPRIKLILHQDDEIDAIYKLNYDKAIKQIEKNNKNVRFLMKIIDINRVLERYGDYAVSIGKWLYFVRTYEPMHLDE